MIGYMFQGKGRLEALEEAIQQAQNRESQMLEMSQWMTEVTSLIQARLDADILAGDIPKEYEASTQTIVIISLIIQ